MTDPYTPAEPGPRRRPKPLVFVAAVYEGNPLEFAHGLVKAARSMWAAGPVVPVLPDLRLVNGASPGLRLSWETDLIERCDALVVIGGRDVPDLDGAEGVERWVDAAAEFGLPVFDGPGPLIEWVRNR